MVYWNTDLKPMSLQFKPRAGDPCSLTERYLVLGIETKLPLIPQAFQAALAFKANGNLATVSTGVEGVDSRFPVPANLSLQGPGGSFYPLTAGAEGYFNNWETPGRPDVGFYNIVGRVRVPFFRDVKVQLHVTPTGPTTAQVAVMGGWPAESGSGANRGWSTGSQDYFNTAKFDPNHDGFPGGLNANTYRNSPDENFHPRAQQNWIDVAFFDYPLTWNPVLREFKGFEPAKVVLPVIDVDSDLKQLTPGKVDFDFAQDISVQLPRLKVLDFANDALNEINSPIHSVSNAIRAALGSALDTSGLTSGFRGLQNVLRENSDTFFRPVAGCRDGWREGQPVKQDGGNRLSEQQRPAKRRHEPERCRGPGDECVWPIGSHLCRCGQHPWGVHPRAGEGWQRATPCCADDHPEDRGGPGTGAWFSRKPGGPGIESATR
jgi:hypothetical protein